MSLVVIGSMSWAEILWPQIVREFKRHYILMDMMERGDSIKDYGYDEEDEW